MVPSRTDFYFYTRLGLENLYDGDTLAPINPDCVLFLVQTGMFMLKIYSPQKLRLIHQRRLNLIKKQKTL